MKINKKFADCFFVKGYSRGILYDLSRESYKVIPNSLVDFVNKVDGKPTKYVHELKKIYNEEIIDEYIDFLFKNEYFFICEDFEVDCFLDLDLEFKVPSKFSNAIFEIKKINSLNWKKVFIQLDSVNCKHIQLVLSSIHFIDDLKYFLNCAKNSRLKSIEIYSPFIDQFNEIKWNEFFNDFKKIKVFFAYNSDSYYHKKYGEYGMGNIIFLPLEININNNYNFHPNYFNVNIDLFTENQKFNSYFNRKLFVNYNGEVVSNFVERKVFGNIVDINLFELFKNKDYTKYWKVDKSKIKQCSKCEFRYMCIDPRVPIYKDNKWEYDVSCNYNPKTMKWKEE